MATERADSIFSSSTFFSNLINDFTQLIGSQKNTYVQQYTECDYKKSNSRSVSHFRIDSKRIKAPYLITNAYFAVCEKVDFIENDNVIESLKKNGTLLVSTELNPIEFWNSIICILVLSKLCIVRIILTLKEKRTFFSFSPYHIYFVRCVISTF